MAETLELEAEVPQPVSETLKPYPRRRNRGAATQVPEPQQPG